MVWIDRSGVNLLHASLAGSGKDLIQTGLKYDDDPQPDLSVLLLLRWPGSGVRMSESK